MALGYTYIAGSSAFRVFKVGRCRNLSNRVAQIKTDSPLPLDLVLFKISHNCEQRETELHREFGSRWVFGEWHELTPADLHALVQRGYDIVEAPTEALIRKFTPSEVNWLDVMLNPFDTLDHLDRILWTMDFNTSQLLHKDGESTQLLERKKRQTFEWLKDAIGEREGSRYIMSHCEPCGARIHPETTLCPACHSHLKPSTHEGPTTDA